MLSIDADAGVLDDLVELGDFGLDDGGEFRRRIAHWFRRERRQPRLHVGLLQGLSEFLVELLDHRRWHARRTEHAPP